MNVVTLVGTVGRAVSFREVSGGSVADFTVKTVEYRGGREFSDYHSVVVWGKQSEDVRARSPAEGEYVEVIGRLRTRKWQDKDGSNRYRTEVNATTVQFSPVPSSAQPVAGSDSDDLPW
jgi:single-strand DNA-binding protein